MNSPEAVMTCFPGPDDWKMQGANQKGFYYDVWALRTLDGWSPDDIWVTHHSLSASLPDDAKRVADEKQKKHIPADFGHIRVLSCFGGCGVYKMEALANCEYATLTPDGWRHCEHVMLHSSMLRQHFDRKEPAGIYINPAMINH